jgi:hypothetical protein
MIRRSWTGTGLAILFLAGCGLSDQPAKQAAQADQAFQSGPQAGEMIPGVFHPLNITGESAGEKACQI